MFTSTFPARVSLHMELSEGLLSSSDFVLLPTSPHAESMSTSRDSLVPPAATNAFCDENNLPISTPHPGMTATVVEEVACRRKEARKARRFGARRSETPFARRRLVFEAEREE